MLYFARCMNIIFNSLLAQLINYDVHTTRKIKSIHTIFYHIIITVTDACLYIHCFTSVKHFNHSFSVDY